MALHPRACGHGTHQEQQWVTACMHIRVMPAPLPIALLPPPPIALAPTSGPPIPRNHTHTHGGYHPLPRHHIAAELAGSGRGKHPFFAVVGCFMCYALRREFTACKHVVLPCWKKSREELPCGDASCLCFAGLQPEAALPGRAMYTAGARLMGSTLHWNQSPLYQHRAPLPPTVRPAGQWADGHSVGAVSVLLFCSAYCSSIILYTPNTWGINMLARKCEGSWLHGNWPGALHIGCSSTKGVGWLCRWWHCPRANGQAFSVDHIVFKEARVRR